MSKILWEGKPSQKTNLGIFVAGIFIALAPIALYRYLRTKHTKIEIREDMIRIHTKYPKINVLEIEYSTIQKINIQQPLFLKSLGLGNLILHFKDATNSPLVIQGLKNAEQAKIELLKRINS